MRFKAKLAPAEVPVFQTIVQGLSRLTKHVVIHLHTSSVTIIANSDDNGGQTYAKLRPEMFTEYRIESRADNHIGLYILVSNLVSALRSAAQASQVTLKLCRRNGIDYLTVDIMGQSAIQIAQNVPVTVLKRDELNSYDEPALPAAQVCLALADRRPMRSVVEKMRSFSRFVTVAADMRGSITLSASSDMVTIKSFFRNLKPGTVVTEEAAKNPPRAVVKVDLHHFCQLLKSTQGVNARALICVTAKCALIVHLRLKNGDGSVTHYMPIVTGEDDDDEEVLAAVATAGKAGLADDDINRMDDGQAAPKASAPAATATTATAATGTGAGGGAGAAAAAGGYAGAESDSQFYDTGT